MQDNGSSSQARRDGIVKCFCATHLLVHSKFSIVSNTRKFCKPVLQTFRKKYFINLTGGRDVGIKSTEIVDYNNPVLSKLLFVNQYVSSIL